MVTKQAPLQDSSSANQSVCDPSEQEGIKTATHTPVHCVTCCKTKDCFPSKPCTDSANTQNLNPITTLHPPSGNGDRAVPIASVNIVSNSGGGHAELNKDVLSLPPAACPYVLSLAGVPPLEKKKLESWDELRNRSIVWLAKHKGYRRFNINDIIMVRGVGWVGPSEKTIEGDCIVINFRQPILVRTILKAKEINSTIPTNIWALPLGFFYSPNPQQQSSLNHFYPSRNRFATLSDLDTLD